MKKILLVEDDAGCLKNIATFLRGEGYEVTEARDGDEALELLTQATFDLILSDIRMPRTDGIRVAENARAISPNIPIILMTAFASGKTRRHVTSSCADDFISKPLLLVQLLKKIDHAIHSKKSAKS